jgi:ferric-dicitrate binding protein FerR (iron transport regulator)
VRWVRTVAAFRRAEASLAAFRAWEAALPAAERAFPACEPLEQRFNDLECRRLAALRRLLRAHAPDLPAFALKVALAVDNEAWELTGAEPCLAAFKADARRLCHTGG